MAHTMYTHVIATIDTKDGAHRRAFVLPLLDDSLTKEESPTHRSSCSRSQILLGVNATHLFSNRAMKGRARL